ncbi:MAG: hypothetical protein A3C55_03725 [Gammaproteobacteria bacterium RIFCSPHIGHO2_02_FULL_42_13]|nr:MAG: hypothetical protein A3C55_03725 [Gammaproteobacteria bacterium RIFCSPHIGHO2_02_FULL_42_13]OGT70221.1 MAG: hypothetical protein A3H43_05955 [Gammaproteobacteria bacterium RIFCSPLOWO2_02_FULL_42_9]
MIKLSFSQLAQVLHLESVPKDGKFCGVSTDTRNIAEGNLFLAIEGPNFDGHDFIQDAKAKGAVAAIVSRPIQTDLPCFVVSDTIQALGKLATYWRKQFKIPLVAITGSNGKTTVKNMIAAVLQSACKKPEHCLVTMGNLNNHIGMPLTLLRLNSKHQFAVIEMGMNHFSEISYLSRMAEPSVAVITNAYPAHLDGVGTLDGVAQAKGEIFQGLSEAGVAVLNADDDYLDYWNALIDSQEILTFGLKHDADVAAKNGQFTCHNSLFTLDTPEGSVDMVLPLSGQHNVMNALAATAACLALDIDLPIIKTALESFETAHSRLVSQEVKNVGWVLDDTYNANPGSVYAAIDVLMSYPDKKILILGDMKELGEDAKLFHHQAGACAKNAGVDYVLAVGEFAQDVVDGFGDDASAFKNKADLYEHLNRLIAEHAPVSVLVKGSRSMKMEEVVIYLLALKKEKCS